MATGRKRSSRRHARNAVVACSGASNVGQMANVLAGRLAADGTAAYYCLAGVAAGSKDTLAPLSADSRVLVIDGCPNGCAKVVMDSAGLTSYSRLVLTELGIDKESVLHWDQGSFDSALDVCRALLEGVELSGRAYLANDQ